MGNHDVGRAMHSAAQGYWAGRGEQPAPSQEEALRVLDDAAEVWRGADAEFDDYDFPDEPLGRLIAIAFGGWDKADHDTDDESAGEHWYEDRIRPFRNRYQFC